MATSDTPDNENKAVFRSFFGAEVLWPLDCSDEVLELTLKELKSLENEHKLAVDKDGLKVSVIIASLDHRAPEEVLGWQVQSVLARVHGQ